MGEDEVLLRIIISLICGATIVYAIAALGEVRFWHLLYWSLPLFPRIPHRTGPNVAAMPYALLVDAILVALPIFLASNEKKSLVGLGAKPAVNQVTNHIQEFI